MLVMSVLGNENTILDGAGRKASISSCKTSFIFSFTPNAFPLQKKKKNNNNNNNNWYGISLLFIYSLRNLAGSHT